MGFIEAAVVVYLRKLFYPAGFSFPLNAISPGIFSVEILREISTFVMLFSVAWVAGRNFHQILAFFLYIFAVWDIFYYVFLKAVLNWPSSFFTWDILFLIPVTWIAPVLAPVICSGTMIIMAGLIIYLQRNRTDVRIKTFEWSFILLGACIIFITFIYDFSKIIITGGFLSKFLTLHTDIRFQDLISKFTPVKYNWWAFSMGILLIFWGLSIFYRRTKGSVFSR